MYTIGQVSEMFNIPVSTLRYYDKEGLFPNLKRKGNIRYFSDNELEALRLIDCLKRSGLEIKDIKQFFAWITEGSNSYGKRKELFEERKADVEAEIQTHKKRALTTKRRTRFLCISRNELCSLLFLNINTTRFPEYYKRQQKNPSPSALS